MKLKITVAVITISAILGFATRNEWNADASAAKIKFDIEGPFGTVHGSFSGLKTTIVFNENDLAGSRISASIDAKTVSTGIGLRNGDLRKKEVWLNTNKYPLIRFYSKKIEKTSAGYKADGDLTIKGITKAVEIPFTFTNKDNTGLFKGKLIVKRLDYNIGMKGGSVGSIITIMLEVPVKK